MSNATTERYRLPPLTPLAFILELLVIVAFAFSATALYSNSQPDEQLDGGEAEWLTSSVHFAALSLRQNGYIPLWQPFLEMGEPLIDNPFSFVLNPFQTLPSLLNGAIEGIKQSVVWTALIAGIGGWVLGRVLGFGWLGRVMLGLLCLGKGNMHAMIGAGYFQLGVAQAYFPWIIAGTLATLRSRRNRWPVLLTAVSFTLMFFAGNIWYTLPTLIAMALLTLTHTVDFRTWNVEMAGLRRMIGVAALTLCLSAVTFLPIWINRDRIGNHPNDSNAGVAVDIGRVIEQYFNGDIELYRAGYAPGEPQFYYSFVVPLWFAIFMFIVLPPIQPFMFRPGMPGIWKIWLVGVFMIVFCTVWGAGGNPIFVWLYNNLPLLGQWRFVGRALAVASFWIGVLVVMRVDGFWRAVALTPSWKDWIWPGWPAIGRALRVLFMTMITVSSLYAAYEVVRQWRTFAYPGRPFNGERICLTWLRKTYPDKPLAVWTLNYRAVTPFLENNVRLSNIAADFSMVPQRSTLFDGNLNQALPEFGIAWEDSSRAYLRENGYVIVDSSPTPVDENHCLYQKPDALPYAFTIPVDRLAGYKDTLPRSAVQPIESLERRHDRIAVLAHSDTVEAIVLALQENAFPGWRVYVDDQPARLESVGGLIGVVLPPDGKQHYIYFQFISTWLYVGGLITLLSLAFSILYLARAERLIPAPLRARIAERADVIGRAALARVSRFMTDPTVFETLDDREARQDVKLIAAKSEVEAKGAEADEAASAPPGEVVEAEIVPEAAQDSGVIPTPAASTDHQNGRQEPASGRVRESDDEPAPTG